MGKFDWLIKRNHEYLCSNKSGTLGFFNLRPDMACMFSSRDQANLWIKLTYYDKPDNIKVVRLLPELEKFHIRNVMEV